MSGGREQNKSQRGSTRIGRPADAVCVELVCTASRLSWLLLPTTDQHGGGPAIGKRAVIDNTVHKRKLGIGPHADRNRVAKKRTASKPSLLSKLGLSYDAIHIIPLLYSQRNLLASVAAVSVPPCIALPDKLGVYFTEEELASFFVN